MHSVGTDEAPSALTVLAAEDEDAASRSAARLLITASTPQGVEALARRIHGAGLRAALPFVHAWACDLSIGADALREQCSSFLDAAAGGSMLISDIEEMPPIVQDVLVVAHYRRAARVACGTRIATSSISRRASHLGHNRVPTRPSHRRHLLGSVVLSVEHHPPHGGRPSEWQVDAGPSAMTVHLVNPSHLSFGVGVITPRWLFVLAGATPASYGRPRITDETPEPFDTQGVQPGDVVWPLVLNDAVNGNVRPIYEAGRVDVERFVAARWKLLPHGRYMWGSVQTVRGCPKALLVLLRLADRRPEAATAARGLYSLRRIWARSRCTPTLRARLAFVLMSKLYRQMYANTGIATDSARVSRANRWARLIARPCRRLFVARPLPALARTA